MDKNTITGLLLIMGLLIGYSWWTAPSEEEKKAQRHIRDSIALVQNENNENLVSNPTPQENAEIVETPVETSSQSLSFEHQKGQYGAFVNASQIPEDTSLIYIKNDLYTLSISKKGGKISSVKFNDILSYDKQPVVLFDSDNENNIFGFTFFSNYLELNTENFYFQPSSTQKSWKVTGNDSLQFSMRLYPDLNENEIDSSSYIEYVYTITGNDFLTRVTLRFQGMDKYLNQTQKELLLLWSTQLKRQERGYENEKIATTIYYGDNTDVENLKESDTKTDSVNYPASLKWISHKQHFFTSTIIADNMFSYATMVVDMDAHDNEQTNTLKTLKSYITIPINNLSKDEFAFSFYFGPNKYNILNKYDIKLEKQIQLGGKLVSWINRFAVLPVFNFFEKFNWSYGIIILILTVILKIILLPLAYKSYMSTAKMRVIKPEIDEINNRYPKQEDSMKKQQAVMAMYKQVGIKPMAGCLPMLIQMPILIAMFRFFPSAYELRQQPFLWADDLSTYDSILDLPFKIPFYGDHVSLFTLLMTVATLTYTILNNKMMSTGGNEQQMKMMKIMMYIMPVMFLGIFNNYSSGLSYYYFLVNIITFIQMAVFRFAINEDKLRKKMMATKAKPVKKSNWQQRMEDMVKAQQAAQRDATKRRR